MIPCLRELSLNGSVSYELLVALLSVFAICTPMRRSQTTTRSTAYEIIDLGTIGGADTEVYASNEIGGAIGTSVVFGGFEIDQVRSTVSGVAIAPTAGGVIL